MSSLLPFLIRLHTLGHCHLQSLAFVHLPSPQLQFSQCISQPEDSQSLNHRYQSTVCWLGTTAPNNHMFKIQVVTKAVPNSLVFLFYLRLIMLHSNPCNLMFLTQNFDQPCLDCHLFTQDVFPSCTLTPWHSHSLAISYNDDNRAS